MNDCLNCKHDRYAMSAQCIGCFGDKWHWKPKVGVNNITFPILNNLTPTVESCTAKVLEEIGELFQLIGKGRRLSGETIEQAEERLEISMIKEALDVAQAAVTMAHVVCNKHGIDIDMMMMEHRAKLYERGYLK